MPPLRRPLAVCFLVLAASLALSDVARADFYEHPWEDRFVPHRTLTLSPELGAYFAPANYDSQGRRVETDGLRTYRRQTADLTIAYGFAQDLSGWLRLSGAAVQVDSSAFSGSAAGAGDQSAGATWRMISVPSKSGASELGVDLQLQADFPGYSNATSRSSGSPILGDASVDLTAGTFLSWPVHSSEDSTVTLLAGLGYTWRSDRYSAQVPGTLRLAYASLASRFGLEAGFQGFQSLRTDSRGPEGVLRPQDGGGGSQRVGARNPSALDAFGAIRFGFGQSGAIRLSLQGTAWGENAPAGFRAAVGATWVFDFTPSRDPLKLTPAAYGKPNQGFVRYAMDAKVTQSDKGRHLVKIDKGGQDGVERGQLIDFFGLPTDATAGEAIARGRVVEARAHDSTVRVEEYFRETFIEEGFQAKRPLQ